MVFFSLFRVSELSGEGQYWIFASAMVVPETGMTRGWMEAGEQIFKVGDLD